MKRFIALLIAFAFFSTAIIGCGPEPDTVTRTQTLADGSTITSTYSGSDAEEYLDDLEDLATEYDNDEDFYEAQVAANPDYYEYGNDGYGYAPQGYQPHYPAQYNSHLSDIVMGVMIGSMLSDSSYRTSHRTTIVNKTIVANNQKKSRNKTKRQTANKKKLVKKPVAKKKPVVKRPTKQKRTKSRKTRSRSRSRRR